MFGAWGGGSTIGGGAGPLFASSSIVIGPGLPYGMIAGGGAGYGCGMEMTMDGGGPAGRTIGGGLFSRLGRLMYMGPGAGPGTITWAGGGGSGGSRASTAAGGDPGGGSRPDEANVFSSGCSTAGGRADIDDGAAEDTAASSTRTATGDSPSRAAGDDAIAFSRAWSVAAGRPLNSCGVADSVFTMDTSAGADNAPRVDDDDERRAASRAATGTAPPGSAPTSGPARACGQGTSAAPSEPWNEWNTHTCEHGSPDATSAVNNNSVGRGSGRARAPRVHDRRADGSYLKFQGAQHQAGNRGQPLHPKT